MKNILPALSRLLAFAMMVGIFAASLAAPAHADRWHHDRGWHRPPPPRHYWRGPPPPEVYAPAPVVYAPPPPESSGLNLILPINIR